MSRTTNFIGLCDRAKLFLSSEQPEFERIPEANLSLEDKRFYTRGMFDEEIELSVYCQRYTGKRSLKSNNSKQDILFRSGE